MAEGSSWKKELPWHFHLVIVIFWVSLFLGGVAGIILGNGYIGLIAGLLFGGLIFYKVEYPSILDEEE